MKALFTYKKTSWINKIAENLDNMFDDFHYIYVSNGDKELINREQERIQDYYENTIRFGTYANYLPPNTHEYNCYEGIKLASNKLKSRKVLKQNHIPVPKTYSTNELENLAYSTNSHEIVYPLIRRSIKHHGGNGVEIINNERELKESFYNGRGEHYYSEFYPKSKEYRVHIASGKAIIVAEKVVSEENQSEYIWNLNNNGVCEEFNTLRWSEYHDIEEIIKVASLSTKALNLDYGAVDVVAYPTERKQQLPPVATLEVNTAPRLEEYGISRYVQYFKWLLLHNDRAEFTLPHKLDRFSFTNEDFEEEYRRLENQTRENNNTSRYENRQQQPRFEGNQNVREEDSPTLDRETFEEIRRILQ